MRKFFLVFITSFLFLFLMAGMASAAKNDFGLGVYDSHGLCLSAKFGLSPEISAQGLFSSDYVGLRGLYDLAKAPNYNFFGFGEFGFIFNDKVAVGLGVGAEFFVFKALNVKELASLGFALDIGLDILPSTGFAIGGGFHYYF